MDPTILLSLNEISQVKFKPTGDTKKTSDTLLDYSSTHKNAIKFYHFIYILIHVNSDTVYIVSPMQIVTRMRFFSATGFPHIQPSQTPNKIVSSSQKSKPPRRLYLQKQKIKRLVCPVITKG